MLWQLARIRDAGILPRTQQTGAPDKKANLENQPVLVIPWVKEIRTVLQARSVFLSHTTALLAWRVAPCTITLGEFSHTFVPIEISTALVSE